MKSSLWYGPTPFYISYALRIFSNVIPILLSFFDLKRAFLVTRTFGASLLTSHKA